MPDPTLPRYERSVAAIVPSLVAGSRDWLPGPAAESGPIVLLVLDGLGWEQLALRTALTPNLAAFVGGPVTTVAPSTTATALTSITTGMTPGEHGIVGYRIWVAGEVLNALRWSVAQGDARHRIPPSSMQPSPPFLGTRPTVVARTEFVNSGFTGAHLAGSPYRGWRMPSTLIAETAAALRAGDRFVYAYYDGIDKVAHEYGVASAHFDLELAAVDQMVGSLLAAMPSGTTLLITADHGQVDVGERIVTPAPDVLALVAGQSGEGRFRWLHSRIGRQADLAEAAASAHGDVAWVVTREQARDEKWFGPVVGAAAWARLGDVALVPFEPISFDDPDDSGPFRLVSRHGSLTSAEMLVPLVAAQA